MPDSEQLAELVPAMSHTPSALPEPAFNRDMCMEFAIGSVAKVLGPEFAVVDTYNLSGTCQRELNHVLCVGHQSSVLIENFSGDKTQIFADLLPAR